MSATFILDSEELKEKERLEGALSELAEADTPLLVELLLVDEDTIRTLNRTQRNIDQVTDVLSFPAMELEKGVPIAAEEHVEGVDEEDRLCLGSVVICEKRAREQAEEYGHSFERELYYLAVHGVLHCLGYDHMTEEERFEMRTLEENVMQKLGLTRQSAFQGAEE